jgi:chaperone BCS1
MILMEDIDTAFTRSVTRDPLPELAYNGGRSPMPGMPPPPSTVTLSGLLNAIDGVQAQQGRLLFATTNKYRALDPALVRPGRLDLHIKFTLASKWQAKELFKRFYPLEKTERAAGSPAVGNRDEHVALDAKIEGLMGEEGINGSESSTKNAPTDESIKSLPATADDPSAVQRILTAGPLPNQRGRKAPRLTPHELEDMSQQFADTIPEGELSMAYVITFLSVLRNISFIFHIWLQTNPRPPYDV